MVTNFKTKTQRFTKFAFDLYVPGFHVYQAVWSPIIGEEDLECKHEKENEEDEFAIGVYCYDLQRETLVRHIPRNISKFVNKFLQLPNLKFERAQDKLLSRLNPKSTKKWKLMETWKDVWNKITNGKWNIIFCPSPLIREKNKAKS